MNDSETLKIGALIGGKYRIDRVLGQGGMGIVYAATHVDLEQRVALKFLLRAAAEHPEMIERFGREARAAVRIQSEHVARVLDVGEAGAGVPYIVMEFLEGESLEQLLATEGRFPIPVAVDFILQTCEALAEAHALGIVHRDIKPANLFRAKRPGRSLIKVLDFGICKVPLDTRAIGITAAETMMGSPGYMSPEQMFGAAAVDERTDIWALGAVLYHLVAGRPPFLADSMPALVAQVLHRQPDSVLLSEPNAPPALVAVIDACLEKEADRRPKNVAELAYALVACGPTGSGQVAMRVAEVLGVTAPFEVTELNETRRAPLTQQSASPPGATPLRADKPIQVRETTLAPMTAPPSTRSTWRATALAVAAVLAGLLFGGFVVHALIKPKPPVQTLAAKTSSAPPVAMPSATPADSSPLIADPTASASSTMNSELTAPSVPAKTAPQASHGRKTGRPPASASPPAASPATPAASVPAAPNEPACQLVSFIDEDGNKRFKKVCP